jgi:NAD(P)H-hydrate epimerase
MTLWDTSPVMGLPARRPDSHKGDYGHVLVIGGSRGMAGAVALAAMAALRSGAGLVTAAVPESVCSVVAQYEPSYMTWPLPSGLDGQVDCGAAAVLDALLERVDVVAIGPGLGRGPGAAELVLTLYLRCSKPMVVDADALFALAQQPTARAGGPRLLTPHPGEFRRLCPDAPRERPGMEEAAIRWAHDHQVTMILKGYRSLITDGHRASHNPTGNPGMATGGSGDVLTGIAAAVLAVCADVYQAARLSAYVHGLAGDRAAEHLGQVALIASDLVRYLPTAWKEMQAV